MSTRLYVGGADGTTTIALGNAAILLDW